MYISMVKPKQTVSSCQNFHSGLPIRILSSPTVHTKTPPRLTLFPPVVHHHVPRNGHNWGVYIPFSDMPKKSYVCKMYIYIVLCIFYIYIYILHILYIYTYIYIYPRKSQFSLIKSPQKSLQWHRKTPAWSRSVADNLVPNTSKSLWAPLHLGAGLRKCSH